MINTYTSALAVQYRIRAESFTIAKQVQKKKKPQKEKRKIKGQNGKECPGEISQALIYKNTSCYAKLEKEQKCYMVTCEQSTSL